MMPMVRQAIEVVYLASLLSLSARFLSPAAANAQSNRKRGLNPTIHFAFFSAGILSICNFQVSAQNKPNILILSTEDINPQLSCYGFPDVKTPNLDSFALQGVRYTNVYSSFPVCAPIRAAIITGVESVAQGTNHMRCSALLSSSVKLFPEYLTAAGYFCSNANGKTDYQGLPETGVWQTSTYITRTSKIKPFLQIYNCNNTHESRISGNPGSLDPAKITTLPPYYPNTLKSRTWWASYLNNIQNLDDWFKKKLDSLQQTGKADSTIVIFFGDNGAGLPRAKRWAYESGLHVPLIVRIPPQYRRAGKDGPGTVNSELISLTDIGPTCLSLAGVSIPAYMQGRAFLGNNSAAPRQYLFGYRDRMDERYEIIRAARDSRYKYIRNYECFKMRQQYNEYPEINAWNGIMAEIRRVYGEANPPPEIKWYFSGKPIEELYDLQNDPYEMQDLAEDPSYTAKLAELRTAHLEWRTQVRDLGAMPEGIMVERRAAYGSEYDMGARNPAMLERAWQVLENLHLLTPAEFQTMISDTDAVVRYWAAIGLGNLLDTSNAVTTALVTALLDISPQVAVAAARGLLYSGNSPAALATLRTMLRHTDKFVRHAAILVLDDLGSRVTSLQADITAAQTDSYDNVVMVAKRALATIDEPPILPCPCKKTTTAISNYAHPISQAVGPEIRIRQAGESVTISTPYLPNASVSVYTIAGKMIGKYPVFKGETHIPAQSLRTGIYVVRLERPAMSTAVFFIVN